MDITAIKEKALSIRQNIEKVIIGKGTEIELVLAALLARGHVLLEDVPGTGKTALSKALARSFDAKYARIQFTPDLLPSDLTGINYYSPKTGEFTFRPGSLFTNILLGDEINRATPRTQAGLLESMEEKQITVDGETYKLENPFFVIATQNPVETQGTFPLPEAQLDRFLIQLSIGYPSTEEGVSIIRRFINDSPGESLLSICTKEELLDMQNSVRAVHVHEDIMKYITCLAEKTRSHEACSLGVGPRGSIAMARMAQAWAAVHGREFVTPDDIKYLLKYVFTHRIILRSGARSKSYRSASVLEEVAAAVEVPTERWER